MEEVDGHLEKDGQIVIEDIRAYFEMRHERGGLKSWDGGLVIPPGAPIEPDEYTLVLEDGRRGDIIVTRINHRGGQAAPDVSFQGSGPLA